MESWTGWHLKSLPFLRKIVFCDKPWFKALHKWFRINFGNTNWGQYVLQYFQIVSSLSTFTMAIRKKRGEGILKSSPWHTMFSMGFPYKVLLVTSWEVLHIRHNILLQPVLEWPSITAWALSLLPWSSPSLKFKNAVWVVYIVGLSKDLSVEWRALIL